METKTIEQLKTENADLAEALRVLARGFKERTNKNPYGSEAFKVALWAIGKHQGMSDLALNKSGWMDVNIDARQRLAHYRGTVWIIDPALPVMRDRISLINPRDTSLGANPLVEDIHELHGEELDRQVEAIGCLRRLAVKENTQ